MIFHVVAMPQTLTTKAFSMCGFTQKTIRFCWMMKSLGHKVFLYGGEINDAVCDEHIVCFSEEDRKSITENSKHYAFPSWDKNHKTWKSTNQTVIKQIQNRKSKNDFICILQGSCQQQIADAFPDLKTVEYGIGYEGFFSKWKIFESHAWRSYSVGRWMNKGYVNNFDHVIHNFFDESEFTPSFVKKPYALFVGRISQIKGIEECCEASNKAGIDLKVIGRGDLNLISKTAEYLGTPSLEERNKLMAEAKVVMCPSKFFEPFGNVACEAQLSATPVICSDWGGYTETVENYKTGFRCSSVNQMVKAIDKLNEVDNRYVYERAIKMFSMKEKRFEYENYFNSIINIL